ncbi:putative transcription factor C2H2 family [Dioscorea sansibarensis]
MAADSSSSSFFRIGDEFNNQPTQPSATPSSSGPPPPLPPAKKKRNPGTPYPDAEVIALSPKTLMATNRFICEVCNKGFQREQNLQLHRRGHNLPWKLRQKNTKEVQRRKVYLCPEPTCVHHDPSRALGDLTGIKKHFCRKHGEKKWKCDKCSKRYAVQSDWKAHSKTCGTREYRCDCGTLFSRRDSFITHRAFCDALAQETSRLPTSLSGLYGNNNITSLQTQSHLRPFDIHQPQPQPQPLFFGGGSSNQIDQSLHGLMQQQQQQQQQQLPELQSNQSSAAHLIMSSDQFNVGNGGGDHHHHHHNHHQSTSLFSGNSLMTDNSSGHMFNPQVMPQMSATALLQKAAQMGATTSSNTSSLFRGFSNSSKLDSETQFHNLMNCMLNPKPNDTLTRDFLGVGSMVRNMGGGTTHMSQRDHHHPHHYQQQQQQGGMEMGSLDHSDMKSGGSSSRSSFPSGSLL